MAKIKLFEVLAHTDDFPQGLICCSGSRTEQGAKDLTRKWIREFDEDAAEDFTFVMRWFMTESTGCEEEAFSKWVEFDPMDNEKVLFPEIDRTAVSKMIRDAEQAWLIGSDICRIIPEGDDNLFEVVNELQEYARTEDDIDKTVQDIIRIVTASGAPVPACEDLKKTVNAMVLQAKSAWEAGGLISNSIAPDGNEEVFRVINDIQNCELNDTEEAIQRLEAACS